MAINQVDLTQSPYRKSKSTNYIVVPNWVAHECGLTGAHALIYSVLYGFSQDQEAWADPTQAYIAEVTGLSRVSVNRTISELAETGWIEKDTVKTFIRRGRNVGSKCFYRAVLPIERYGAEAYHSFQAVIAEEEKKSAKKRENGRPIGKTPGERPCNNLIHGVHQSDTRGITDCYTHNNKEDIKEINPSPSHSPYPAEEENEKEADELIRERGKDGASLLDDDSRQAFDDLVRRQLKPVYPTVRAKTEQAYAARLSEGTTPELIAEAYEAYRCDFLAKNGQTYDTKYVRSLQCFLTMNDANSLSSYLARLSRSKAKEKSREEKKPLILDADGRLDGDSVERVCAVEKPSDGDLQQALAAEDARMASLLAAFRAALREHGPNAVQTRETCMAASAYLDDPGPRAAAKRAWAEGFLRERSPEWNEKLRNGKTAERTRYAE